MEALSAGQHHQFDVDPKDTEAMTAALLRGVTAGGRVTGAAFQGAAWARYDRWVASDHTPELLRWADTLIELQNQSGAVIDDDARRPITGGTMQTTFQSAQAWRQAYARTADEKWLIPLRKAEAYLAQVASAWKDSGEDADLQDLNFALLGLVATGAGPTEPGVLRLRNMLIARQNQDGGFALDRGASDAFATGQSVYALKMAGFDDEHVSQAQRYLLENQDQSGAWHTYRSNQGGAEKGETMWAVLGLVTVDVARIRVAGLADGAHAQGTLELSVAAEDNTSGGIEKLELRVDDLPVEKAAGPALEADIDADALSEGLHIVEVVATNKKGQQSRRRLEMYTGKIQLTHLGANYDEAAKKTVITARSIGDSAGKIGLEIWDLDEAGEPKAKVWAEDRPAALGPIAFDWSGQASDGKARGRGRYLAKLSRTDAKGDLVQSESTLFFQDSAAAQREAFGEIEGQVSLGDGLASTNTVVELVDQNDRVVQVTKTTEQGNYRFKNVSSGGYKVRAQKSGFRKLEQDVRAEAKQAPAKSRMSW